MPLSFLLFTIASSCLLHLETPWPTFPVIPPSSEAAPPLHQPRAGGATTVMAAWSFLIYDPGVGLGYGLPWPPDRRHGAGLVPARTFRGGRLRSVTFVVIWTLTHNGIQLSMRVTALLGGLELLIMLSLSITFLVHPGKGIHVHCAARSLVVAPSLWRHPGGDGLLRPRAQRVRRSSATRPGKPPARESSLARRSFSR